MHAILDPLAILWMVSVLAAGFLWKKRQRLASLLIFAAAGLLWCLEVLQVSARLMASLEQPYLGVATGDLGRHDVIIVLGGFGNGTSREVTGMDLSPAADRLLTGMELLRERKAKVLVVSWGSEEEREVKRSEAWVKAWKPGEVVSLKRSGNTREEAVNSVALCKEKGWQRVALVTSAWHLRRATSAFRKAGLEVTPVGCDFQGASALERDRCYVPQSESLVLLRYWLHEMVGSAYYRFKGWSG